MIVRLVALLTGVFALFGVLGDFGSLGTLLGAAVVLDVFAALALIVGFTVVRPLLAERLRS